MKSNKYNIGDYIGGEYKILDIFGGEGKSGMGVVYLVKNREYDYPIVLKTFQPKNKTIEDRFLEEAKVWISLSGHPNIVKAHFVEKFFQEQIFICAEYIDKDSEGRNTITDYLKQGEQPISMVLKWSAQFCYAMKYALNKGLNVHRDIKPDNLMVEDGNLKITDFGLSKISVEIEEGSIDLFKQELNLTNDNTFLGTYLYASPEQLRDSKHINFKSDMYSFGLVLYQLISNNKFPYVLSGVCIPFNYKVMHESANIIPINHIIFPVVEKCLNKDPNNRYANYDLMLDDIRLISKELNISLPDNDFNVDNLLWELFTQSKSYMSLNEPEKALKSINEYLSLNSEHESAWTQKGRILLEMGRYDEALEVTKISLSIYPENSHALNNLGLIYKHLSKFDLSLKSFKEAISIDPYNSGALMNMANVYLEIKDYIYAASAIINALKINPNKKSLHFNASNLAAIISKNGYIDGAINILELLVKIGVSNSYVHFNLGLLYMDSKRTYEAINCFLEVEKINPIDGQALEFLLNLYVSLSDYDKCLSYCDKLIHIDSFKTRAICFKAQILQAYKGLNNAISFLTNYLKSNPENDVLLHVLAEIYYRDGDMENSYKVLLKTKEVLLRSNSEYIKDNLEMIEEKLNHIKSRL